MKHIKLKSFGLALLLSLGACKKDFLQQNDPNSVAVTNYFKTENDVLLAAICGQISGRTIQVQMIASPTRANHFSLTTSP
jgi:hypothetical protein